MKRRTELFEHVRVGKVRGNENNTVDWMDNYGDTNGSKEAKENVKRSHKDATGKGNIVRQQHWKPRETMMSKEEDAMRCGVEWSENYSVQHGRVLRPHDGVMCVGAGGFKEV